MYFYVSKENNIMKFLIIFLCLFYYSYYILGCVNGFESNEFVIEYFRNWNWRM